MADRDSKVTVGVEGIKPLDWAAALEAARLIEPRVKVDGVPVPFILAPNGYQLHDLEDRLPAPTRKKGKLDFDEADSLIAYANRYEQAGRVLFADVKQTRFVIVLDHHTQEAAGWGDWTATYTCPRTLDWQRWVGIHNKPLAQAAFAEFLEDMLPTVAQPDGAALLEIAQELTATVTGSFKSALNLRNGNLQFEYTKEVDASTSKGQVRVPEKFKIALSPFQGGEVVFIDVRLRYRLTEGKLSFICILDQPEKVLEDAFRVIAVKIAEGTKLTCLYGRP